MLQRMMSGLISRLGSRLTAPLRDDLRHQQKALRDHVRATDQRLEAMRREQTEATSRSLELLDDMHRTLETVSGLQADLRTLLRARDRQGQPPVDGGAVLPVTVAAERPATPPAVSEVPGDRIALLTACPVCGHRDSTLVCEYNKLLLLDAGVDDDAPIYNYALCHACGVVSARQRPTGRRYAWLLDRFELTLGRTQEGLPPSRSLVLGSDALTDDERETLRSRAARGVFVSEHLGLPKGAYVPALLKDRMANAVHVEMIGSLVPLQRPRVLEVRPRLGSIGAALQRLYHADVYTLPLFEGQQFLIGETYGFHVEHKVDFDRFAIPYVGTFDLVVANHMLTHVVNPCEFLATIHARLNDDGYVYLYNEADEGEYLGGRASMINTLNAFHLQTFDVPSLGRALASAGFEPTFIGHHGDTLIAVARRRPRGRPWQPMPAEQRERRVHAYQRARDVAILRLPEEKRGRFAGEWPEVVARALSRGDADFDRHGRVRLVRRDR